MPTDISAGCDAVLQKAASGYLRVPGVAAMATDRHGPIYEGVAGKRVLGAGGHDADMTLDTVFAMFSTTKAITTTAALQLAETGKLDLDAPAKSYIPGIGALQVLDGFDRDGRPRLRAPKRDITTRMLLLHTAGFAYDFFNADYLRLATEHGQPSVLTASKASLNTPLLFDPGERWEYGSNMDWAGQVVEAVTGQRLGQVMQDRIFEPLGMTSSGFVLTPDMRSRMAYIHQRDAAGALTPLMDLVHPQEPEVHMGGHGLYSTVPDSGLLPVHPHVAERRRRGARPGAAGGDGRDGGSQRPWRPEDQGPARRDAHGVARRGVLPRHEQVVVAGLHDQRGGRGDRPAGRVAGVGGAGEPILLD